MTAAHIMAHTAHTAATDTAAATLRDRLPRFLAAHDVLGGESIDVRAVGDGHSNLTFLVTGAASGRRMVLRRPPATHPQAHDVLREARFLAALRPVGVPVPRVLATAAAGELIEVPCYLMSYAAGPIVTDRTPDALAHPVTRRQAGLALADTLAALHAVDWRAAGLADMGRPEGFNARHVRRMARLVHDADDRLPDAFADVHDWLLDTAPAESDATVVHNDYRLGNVVLGAVPPGRVEAILDWELATLGDPLLDVGYFLASVPEGGEPATPTQRMAAAWAEPGWPSRAELAERYARVSGRDLSDLTWYTTLAQWKLATLYEFSRRQAVHGEGDPYYLDPTFVPDLLAASRRAAGLPARDPA